MRDKLLTVEGWRKGGRGMSRIIGMQESLVLYILFISLCVSSQRKVETRRAESRRPRKNPNLSLRGPVRESADGDVGWGALLCMCESV
jgi:hypothetical protein